MNDGEKQLTITLCYGSVGLKFKGSTSIKFFGKMQHLWLCFQPEQKALKQ